MKYKVNNKRIAGFLAGVLVYAAVSLYASVGLSANKFAMALAIHLSLSAVTSVAVLWLMFKPIERIESNEKAQTVPQCSDSGSDCCHP